MKSILIRNSGKVNVNNRYSLTDLRRETWQSRLVFEHVKLITRLFTWKCKSNDTKYLELNEVTYNFYTLISSHGGVILVGDIDVSCIISSKGRV